MCVCNHSWINEKRPKNIFEYGDRISDEDDDRKELRKRESTMTAAREGARKSQKGQAGKMLEASKKRQFFYLLITFF